MLARSQLSKVNTKGSCLSFDIPAMCKINKTRSGQAIGGAGHGAAGGTHGTGGGGGSGDAGSGGGGHGGVNGAGTPRGATSTAWHGKPMGSGGSNRVAAFGTKTLNAPAQTPPRILAHTPSLGEVLDCFALDVPELQLLRRRIPARPLASHLDAPQGHDGSPPDGGRVAPAALILHNGPEGPVAAMVSIHNAVRLHLRFGNVHVLVLSKCPCRAMLSLLLLPSQLLIGRVLGRSCKGTVR